MKRRWHVDQLALSRGHHRHRLRAPVGALVAHGLLITKGHIEPFIVTLGTLGIFRAYLTYFANGGTITLDNAVSDVYSPVYYGSVLGLPIRSGSSCSPP